MDALEVFDPSGAIEVTQLHAPRLDNLNGKTIGFISNDMWQAHRMLPLQSGALNSSGPVFETGAQTTLKLTARLPVSSENALQPVPH